MQPAPNRGASAGGHGGIKRVDVKGHISRMIAHNSAGARHGCRNTTFVHLARVDHIDAEVIFGCGANADLHRTPGVHQPGFHRLVKHGAVINPRQIIIGPQIGMRIKMDHCKGTKFFSIGPEDRKSDIVIAPQSDAACPGPKDFGDMRG